MDPFFFWTEELKAIECESVGSAFFKAGLDMSFKMICQCFCMENKHSHAALHHMGRGVSDCSTAMNQTPSTMKKTIQKNFTFLSESPVKRGWMNGYMYIVPDTGNDDVLSWSIFVLTSQQLQM